MLLALLGIIATALTVAMFSNKQAVMGFACGIFWALTGAQSYTLSTVTWDIYFLFAFSCLLGMLVLTIFGAYALREKRDAIGDQEMERGEGKYIDEKSGKKDLDFYEDDGIAELDDNMRPRTRSVSRRTKSKRKGEFDF